PQILQLGYERLQPLETEEQETAQRKGLSTDDLFQAFFREVQGRDLTDAEKALFHQVVDEVDAEGRNA
ncbi:MAG: exonuclease sbcCD subunit D, partial [Acidaminococcus sp.]|nr:exonuclease sbcCD subunit D [Acidaminococcus sp.]